MQRCETQTEMYIKQRMFKRVRDTLDILENQMNAYMNKKSGVKNDCKLNKKLIIVYVYSYVYSIFGNKFYFINETPRKL